MLVSQKPLTWLVLASYLFANSIAASLHDHDDCCAHATVAPHAADEHDHSGHDHAGYHQTRRPNTDGDRHGPKLRSPHYCAVCEFLAQAPLTAPVAELSPAGELPPSAMQFSRLVISQQLAGTHLPRGPPAQGERRA